MSEVQQHPVQEAGHRFGPAGHRHGPPGGDRGGPGDVGLVVGIGRGQRAALAEVCRRYGGEMHGLASRVCGADRGDEVVSEVLLGLWRDPERFAADRCSLRGFLLQEAHARAVELARADAPRRAQEAAALLRRTRRRRGPETARLARQAGDHGWRRLSTLPDDERTAIVLAYLCGYSCREQSELLGHPPEAFARRIRSGLIGLRRRSFRE